MCLQRAITLIIVSVSIHSLVLIFSGGKKTLYLQLEHVICRVFLPPEPKIFSNLSRLTLLLVYHALLDRISTASSDQQWEINKSELTLGRERGSGQFGVGHSAVETLHHQLALFLGLPSIIMCVLLNSLAWRKKDYIYMYKHTHIVCMRTLHILTCTQCVVAGRWKGKHDVAVKMMKEGAMKEDDFMKNSKVMK